MSTLALPLALFAMIASAEPECPAGKVRDAEGQCVVPPTCPAGQVLVSNKCRRKRSLPPPPEPEGQLPANGD